MKLLVLVADPGRALDNEREENLFRVGCREDCREHQASPAPVLSPQLVQYGRRSTPLRPLISENPAQLCRLKASRTVAGGFPGAHRATFATIQLHIEHPHAAKLLFSSQTSSRSMPHSLPQV